MEAIKRIEINVINKTFYIRIPVMQNDTGRVIECDIVDWTIPEGTSAKIWAMKPSGKIVYNDCFIEGNAVKVSLTNQMLAEKGYTACKINFEKDGQTVSSFEFVLDVNRDISGNGTESTNESTVLEKMFAELGVEVEAAIQKAKDEADRAQGIADTVQELGAEQIDLIEQKGEETLASIPQDYTDLTEEVSQLSKEITDAREGYFGESYDTLEKRLDGDFNAMMDKADVMNYKDTSIHANNTYARNITANGNKVEVLGQTIQNCLDHSSADKFASISGTVDDEGYINVVATGSIKNLITKKESVIVKPNTDYTFIVEVLENTLVGSNTLGFGYVASSSSYFLSGQYIPQGYIGVKKFVIRTKDDFTNVKYGDGCGVTANATSGSIKFRYAIIEGDWTDKEISWVPFGLNTPQSTEVKMCGKNLLNFKDIEREDSGIKWSCKDNLFHAVGNTTDEYSTPGNSEDYYKKLKPGKYFLSRKSISDDTGVIQMVCRVVRNGKYTYYIDGVVRINGDESEIRIYPQIKPNSSIDYEFYIMLEYGSLKTEFTEYTGNSVEIPHTLGSVSDTIRDRVYLKDGKAYYEKNVEEITLDGSDDENWKVYSTYNKPNTYIGRIADTNTFFAFKSLLNNYVSYGNFDLDVDGAANGQKDLVVRDSRFETVEDFKNHLKSNNIKIILNYQTPITTEISLEDFYSYAEQTNWYMVTDNGVKPTLDVDIPSNLNALVSNLMVENSYLKKENQTLTEELENQKQISEESVLLINTILGVEEYGSEEIQ